MRYQMSEGASCPNGLAWSALLQQTLDHATADRFSPIATVSSQASGSTIGQVRRSGLISMPGRFPSLERFRTQEPHPFFFAFPLLLAYVLAFTIYSSCSLSARPEKKERDYI